MKDIIMYGFYKTYMNMFNKNIISQADDDQDDLQLDEETDDTDDKELDDTQTDSKEELDQDDTQDKSDQQETKLSDQKDNKIDMKFSADLASEFGNTVNQFTHIAATVIKQRSINKENTDKIYDLMSKIKDLLDAASKSI